MATKKPFRLRTVLRYKQQVEERLQAELFRLTQGLAEVNPGLLRRVANQIRLTRSDSPVYAQVSDTLEQMLIT